MKDRELLRWVHSRLVEIHGENPSADYMHKLAALAAENPTPCSCWTTMEDRLREKGFKISSACSALSISGTSLTVRRYLPLQRADGKSPKRSEPKGLAISHCPFCGQAFPETSAEPKGGA